VAAGIDALGAAAGARSRGRELVLPSWDRAVAEDWLGKWAMNLMWINVSTRKFRRAVRNPEGDVPGPPIYTT
jgi:putative transposase